MRTTRAFLAGLGTTGSLVAAAACVFLIASAVIAFRGWPGAGFADRVESLFVNDEPPVAWDQPGTQAVAAGATTAAGAVAATAAGPTFGAPGLVLTDDGTAQRGGVVRLPDGSQVSTGPSGPGTIPGTGSGVPAVPGTGSLPEVPAVGDGSAQNNVADTVEQTGSGVGRTVRDTTQGVGNTVGGPVGDTVTNTGNQVGNTVDNVTSGVGDVLRPGQ
jgi:hypothetical protein